MDADAETTRCREKAAEKEAHTRKAEATLAVTSAELTRAKAELHRWRQGAGGKTAEAWAEAERLSEALEEARRSLEAMQSALQKSAADRASLVQASLESLSQLSGHLTYTLGGLRIGQDRELDAPLLQTNAHPIVPSLTSPHSSPHLLGSPLKPPHGSPSGQPRAGVSRCGPHALSHACTKGMHGMYMHMHMQTSMQTSMHASKR